jgi:uncharacterized membrane protein
METVEKFVFPLTLGATLGSGLIAGVFFAFSAFVMRALVALPAEKGIAAMQSVNVAVLNPVFLSVFMGTAALSLAALVYSFLRWNTPGTLSLLVGGLLYFLGTFLVTAIFNVPLNDSLATVQPDSTEGAAVWANYLRVWTLWNHVRTVAAIAASTAFILALCQRAAQP